MGVFASFTPVPAMAQDDYTMMDNIVMTIIQLSWSDITTSPYFIHSEHSLISA